VVGAGAREEDSEADGTEHEDDGGVGGQLGEKVGCAARAERCLRALTAEGSGEVGRFALLEEDDADDKERDDDVKSDEKTDQHNTCNPLGSGGKPGDAVWIGAEEELALLALRRLHLNQSNLKCIIGFFYSQILPLFRTRVFSALVMSAPG
jgi:hypothetical protein